VKDTGKIFTVVVCGPTASGKTALAVRISEIFGGEIIGADSMQIYKEMDIATAKPTKEELRGIKHHLINFLEPHESFSVAEYVEAARIKIAETAERGNLPVIVGGTGLYISSLVDNICFPEIKADADFRFKMQELKKQEGAEFLLEKLRENDPETAAELHPNNIKRIIRALEVFHVTGKTMSRLKHESRLTPSPYEPLMLQIDLPRERLYERINKRVDLMLEAGLVEEARKYFDALPNAFSASATSIQAIGYKELLPYLKGEAELFDCVDELKKSTRNYAKRQLTWFKKEPRMHMLGTEYNDESAFFEEALRKAQSLIEESIQKNCKRT